MHSLGEHNPVQAVEAANVGRRASVSYRQRSLDYPNIAAWGLLRQAAEDYPDRPACWFLGKSHSYQSIWEDACRTAELLRKLGVRSGDRVGLLLPNVPEYLVALNGVWLAGGIAVAISPLMVRDEVSMFLDKTGCRIVIALDLLASRVLEADTQPDHTLLVTVCERLPMLQSAGCVWLRRRETGRWQLRRTPRISSFHTEIANHRPMFQSASASLADPAYILPTGGTTGNPKAVVLSHRNLVTNALQQVYWNGGRRGEEVFMAVLPFFHSYGLSTCLMTGIASAATLILQHRFDAVRLLRLIERYHPTVFHAVPAMLAKLNKQLRRKRWDLSAIRFCISGGAPLPSEVADEFTEHSGAIIVEGYGLSEASPVTHVGPLDGSARPGTIGLPLPDTEARIVDVETGRHVLRNGQVGELTVRGPQVMLGYWNNPDETRRVVRDGWLFTGDLAARDEDGFFRIVDRKKDLIITSGFNVYPEEVEEVLRQHPDVCDTAVIGVPDPNRGEIVKALIVLKDGLQLNRKSLERFCRERLGAHKRPVIFEAVSSELPRNFLGKLMRRHLRLMPYDNRD